MKKYLIYTFAVVWVVALLGAATIGLVQQARGATANETMLRNDVFDLLQEKERLAVRNDEVEQIRLSLERRVLELQKEVSARLGDIDGLDEQLLIANTDKRQLDQKLKQAEAVMASQDELIRSLTSN